MEQQLSNIEAILLSAVKEKPSYAYEIHKATDDMRRWVKVGVASIFQVLKRLEEKEFVYSLMEREGKMPVRKRYYITKAGNEALVETAKKLLSGFEWHYLDLNVGLETSDVLTVNEIAECLSQRLAAVTANITRLKEAYNSANDVLAKKRAIIRNLFYLREAEEKLLQEVLQEFELGSASN